MEDSDQKEAAGVPLPSTTSYAPPGPRILPMWRTLAPPDIPPMLPAAPTRSLSTFFVKSNPSPSNVKRVFRFLNSAQYADDFVNGELRISTLGYCRKCEDPLQGDRGEGTIAYRSKDYHGVDWDSPGFREDAARAGAHIGEGVTDITFYGNTGGAMIPDALVLCTTVEFDPSKLSDTFGNYCVEIFDIDRFFETLSRALVQRYPIQRFYSGRVQYMSRDFHGVPPPTDIGLIKPPDPYQPQQEFRMIWFAQTSKELVPGNIKVPKLAQFCRRIA